MERDGSPKTSGRAHILAWAWSLIGSIFVIAYLPSRPAAAMLMVLSVLAAVPILRDVRRRYNLNGRVRIAVIWGAALLAGFGAEKAVPVRDDIVAAADAQVDDGADTITSDRSGDASSGQGMASLGEIEGCAVTDGDTLKCGGERIRLLGIDAPELPGHCREGRECAPGDPYAASRNLITAIQGIMSIERVGTDRYGRTLAIVYAGSQSLSCIQLQAGLAIYKPDWDNGSRIQRECPASAIEVAPDLFGAPAANYMPDPM